MAKMTAAEVIAEVEWLLDGGMHPLYIAEAIGRTTHALNKLMWRHGRSDLARLFDQSHQRRTAA